MQDISTKSKPVLTLSAPAKINLTLEVLGKRSDGYHDIASVIHTISLSDTLTLAPAPKLTFCCDVEELDGSHNLVLQAANMLREEMGVVEGAEISLGKGIPVAVGLGGGSSDAAAALKGLSRLWGLGLGTDDLLSLAIRLGSDVPFFLRGGAALVEGRGDKVTPLPSLSPRWLVLAAPPHRLPNKTATLYKRLVSTDYTSGEATVRLAEGLHSQGEMGSADLYNAFEGIAWDVFPRLEEYRNGFLRSGVDTVHLSGTGPSLYSLVKGQAEGERVRRALAERGIEAFLVSTSGPGQGFDPGE